MNCGLKIDRKRQKGAYQCNEQCPLWKDCLEELGLPLDWSMKIKTEREIFEFYKSGCKQETIAREARLHRSTISRIITRQDKLNAQQTKNQKERKDEWKAYRPKN